MHSSQRQGDWFLHRKIDSIVNQSVFFELVGGLLFRRLYDDVEGEVQLRCCIPTGASGQFDVAGHGFKPLGYRERLRLKYHSGPLAVHQGGERMAEMLGRDFWWPGLHNDVKQ